MHGPVWFYRVADRQIGPVTLAALQERCREGVLQPSDMVWRTGYTTWVTAGAVPELFPGRASALVEPAATRRGHSGLIISVGILITFIVGAVSIHRGSGLNETQKSYSTSSGAMTSTNGAEFEEAVNDLRTSGFIYKTNAELNEVLVSRQLWETTTLDQKKTIGYVLGHYCGCKKGSNNYWVEIKDHRTGKRLAKWSESRGMKIDD